MQERSLPAPVNIGKIFIATVARRGALARVLGRHSPYVRDTDMAATTEAIRTTTMARRIAAMVDRSLRTFKPGWPAPAITRVRLMAWPGQAYEYRHGLPVDGRIDGRLLARMGL